MDPVTRPRPGPLALDTSQAFSRAECDAIEEFEELLAYDWQDDRNEYYARVRALYGWAENRPALRSWMAARVTQTAGNVRPSLSHVKLWPLAFLLGQDCHLINTTAHYEGYSIFLYHGVFYALPAGSDIVGELSEERGTPRFMSSQTPDELRARIDSIRRATTNADGLAAPISGPDVLWLGPSQANLIESYGQHNILSYLGCFWAIPHALGPVDLADPRCWSRPDVKFAESRDELLDRLRRDETQDRVG